MSIHHVLSKRFEQVKVNQVQPSLKAGQIVQGKIVKLYPNNKAQIQIGSQSLIAQLEASLSIGENYHFQVKSNTDVIHLRVLSQSIKNSTPNNMLQLLQSLGIKVTKANIAVLEHLTKNKVPFDKEQLMKAIQLVEGAKNKAQAQLVVQEMLRHKLPLTDSVFQALYVKSTSGITEQLSDFLQQLKQDLTTSPIKQSLIDRLTLLTEPPASPRESVSKQILGEINSNKTTIFQMIKSLGLVDNGVDLSTWKSEWQHFAKNATNTKLPFQLNVSELQTVIEQALKNKNELITKSQNILQQFTSGINRSIIHQIPMASSNFEVLQSQVENQLLPLLPGKQQQLVQSLLQNNVSTLEQFQTLLKTLTNETNYSQMQQLVKNMHLAEALLLTKPQEAFLSHFKQVLQSIGFSHEFNIANDLPEQHSIKSLIMQLIQQSEGATNERAVQLLQFINGMQIQSVNDTTNFIQASLQLPGEKLGLNNDLQLDFEGKKTESGEIDPAYCRILFYLDLANLKETVVDMNIQKRTVAVTVFNDHPSVADHSIPLRPLLKEGLELLDYHLSTIHVKPFKQVDADKDSSIIERNTFQGVDYRI